MTMNYDDLEKELLADKATRQLIELGITEDEIIKNFRVLKQWLQQESEG